MVKLDTMNAVLDWATCQDPNAINGEDRPTAAYLAECVRKAEAIDADDMGNLLAEMGAHLDARSKRWVISDESLAAGAEAACKRIAENELLRQAFEANEPVRPDEIFLTEKLLAAMTGDAMQ